VCAHPQRVLPGWVLEEAVDSGHIRSPSAIAGGCDTRLNAPSSVSDVNAIGSLLRRERVVVCQCGVCVCPSRVIVRTLSIWVEWRRNVSLLCLRVCMEHGTLSERHMNAVCCMQEAILQYIFKCCTTTNSNKHWSLNKGSSST